MKESENNLNYNKYFRVISSSDFEIEKDDIFYRDKYNDIINYLKGMLINDEYSTIQQYIKPKGLLLININPGTDILDFLHLISKNYYLDIVELNYFEIIKSPSEFIDNLNSIIQNILDLTKKNKSQNKVTEPAEIYEEEIKNNTKQLLIINQSQLTGSIFEEKSLLKIFLNYYVSHKINFLENGIILVWINENLNEVEENSNHIFRIFDLFIKIPLLNEGERETVLNNFAENNPKIVFDIQSIMNFTEDWEVLDLNNLLKTGILKHFLNSDLNNKSNEITEIIINLIKSGEYIPSTHKNNRNLSIFEKNQVFTLQGQYLQNKYETKAFKLNQVQSILKDIQEQPISEFMLNQLYEHAASKHYTELVLIIDKLNKKEILEDNDKKLLAKYPFIMNDSPNSAQINLEKAKKRIDHIKQSFGK